MGCFQYITKPCWIFGRLWFNYPSFKQPWELQNSQSISNCRCWYFSSCCLERDLFWMVRTQKGISPVLTFLQNIRTIFCYHIHLWCKKTCEGFDCIFAIYFILILFLEAMRTSTEGCVHGIDFHRRNVWLCSITALLHICLESTAWLIRVIWNFVLPFP